MNMFTKIFFGLSFMTICTAEPPSSYLPPSMGYSYQAPPSSYMAPRPTMGYRQLNTDYGERSHHSEVHERGMPYDFNYAVKDDYYGTDYSHKAASDGDVVKGEYRVQLPDGRLQIVTYWADWKTGFHADVRYEGSPIYASAQKAPSSSYGPPSYQFH